MIVIKATAATRKRYTANIVRVFSSATGDQFSQGMHWYANANAFARMLADSDDPRDTVQMAGMIAALSANKAWDMNQKLATDAANGDIHGHTSATLAKVAKIMAGADPAEVLPMALKTGNFYRCISDPSDPDAVVIDRHAHDVATDLLYGNSDRGLSNANRYAMLAHCYREAAQQLGVLPSEVQAVTWVVWTERWANTSTRGNRYGKQDN